MTPQFDPPSAGLQAALQRLVGELDHRIGVLRKEAIVFGLIGAVLAAFGVGLELHLKSTLETTTEELKSQVNVIRENVTTRSLPNWPNLAPDLTSLVKNFVPGNELAIDADIGYTHFTEPNKFLVYFDQLLTLVRDNKNRGTVRILVPDYDTEMESLLNQFDDEEFSTLWKQNEDNKFKKYCEVDWYRKWIGHTRFCQVALDQEARAHTKFSKEEFFIRLLYVENQLCDQLINASGPVRVLIRKINDPHLTSRNRHIWVLYSRVEGDSTSGMKEMVFSYPRFAHAKKGYAWHTEDRFLMEMFLTDFQTQFESDKNQDKSRNQIYLTLPVTRDAPLYSEALEQCKDCTRN